MPTRRVMVDHITIGVSDLQRSRDFYLQALAPLGFDETSTSEILPSEIEFGSAEKMDFAISTDYDVGAPVHVAFAADSIEQVHAFHAAALAAGGREHGPLTTARATTAPSCSTPTGTMSRPSFTAERDSASRHSVSRSRRPVGEGSRELVVDRCRQHANRMLRSRSNVDDPNSQRPR